MDARIFVVLVLLGLYGLASATIYVPDDYERIQWAVDIRKEKNVNKR